MHYVAEINRNIVANEFDDIDIFDLLLSYGGDVNFQTKLVNIILEFRCYLIFRYYLISIILKSQETAIHYCAESGI
jgi:hypothetical protein